MNQKSTKCEIVNKRKVRYSENPFMLSGLNTRKTRKVIKGSGKKGGNMLFVTDGGEELNVPGFYIEEYVDKAKFIKLFIGGVRRLKDLTNAGTKVFEILYCAMQEFINSDRIYLSHKSLSLEEKKLVSRATFQRGLSELINKNFLASSELTHWYWINPDYIWNGDRLAFIQAYRKKVNERTSVKALPSPDEGITLPLEETAGQQKKQED